MSDALVQVDENVQGEIQPAPPDQPSRDLLSVARGGGIAFIGTIATRGLSYIYSFALIRALGAENFGQFTLALSIVTFVGLLSNIGLPQGVIRYGTIQASSRGKAGAHEVTMAAIRVVVPVSLLIMVVVMASASGIANLLFHKGELTGTIRILSISIPLMSIQGTMLAATRSLKVIKPSTIVGVAQPLIALLLAVVLSYLNFGMDSASIAYVVSYIYGIVFSIYYYLMVVPPWERSPDRYPLRSMLKFSVPLSMTEWMHFANERTEIFFLGLLPGSVNISIYKIAWSLAGLETMLRLSLEQMLAPFSSDLSHRREIKQLGDLYKATAKWGFTAALMIFLVYLLFGTEIMRFFDPSLVAGGGALVALAAAQLFNEFTGPCNTILIMSGRSNLSLMNTIILFFTSVALDWYLIPRYGLTGAAIAGASAVIFVNILRVVEVWWTLKIHPFKLSFVKPVLAGVIVAGVIFAFRSFVVSGSLLIDLVMILFFCLAYLIVTMALRLDSEDWVVIDAMKRKAFTFIRPRPVTNPQ